MTNNIYSLQDFAKVNTRSTNNNLKIIVSIVAFTLLLTVYAIASTMEFNTLTKANEARQANVNALYEQDMRDEINLSQEDIKILQVIDNN